MTDFSSMSTAELLAVASGKPVADEGGFSQKSTAELLAIAGGKPAPEPQQPKPLGAPEELTFAERYVAPALERIRDAPGVMGAMLRLGDGNARGSAVGRAAMGAADPGVAVFQLGANAVGAGDSVNKAIADTEAKYQAARAAQGSTGFDPARLAGNIAITAPLGGLGPAATTVPWMAAKGAAQGAISGALTPVTEGDSFLEEKAKQVGIGAAGGAALSPVAGVLARIVSPNASVNPKLDLLRAEGVKPTVGQALGGVANSIEEKLQSVPILGDAIRSARSSASDQLRKAAIDRAAKPIGAKIQSDGGDAVAELSAKIGQAYDDVLPKMSANVLDNRFLGKMESLRAGVQNGFLPQSEKDAFDAVIAREIDGRLSPNGTLSGQGLKDAWIALRELGTTFSKSQDPYQAKLGGAFKQVFQELKDHVTASNAPADVIALKNADLAWANFKRVQRAAGAIGAPDGEFTPAQLQSAVKALDKSKDKARFSEGDALMQDLSSAGKTMLTGKVPDSGTPTRLMWGLGGLATGVINPAIPAALVGGAAAYAPPVQNALVYLLSRRPDLAPQLAERLRRMSGPLGIAGGFGAVDMAP